MKTKQQQNREYYVKYRDRILLKKKLNPKTNAMQYPVSKQKRREYWKSWYAKNAPAYLKKKREYADTPDGKQNELERLYRFIERHPEYDIEYLERLIKAKEKTVSISQLKYVL